MIITTSSSAANQSSLVNLHQYPSSLNGKISERLAVVHEEEKKAEEDVVMPIASDKLEGEQNKDAKMEDLLHQAVVVGKEQESQKMMEGQRNQSEKI